MENTLIFVLAVIHMILSNLLTMPVYHYLATRPPLSQTIITILNIHLVLAYNLHTAFIGIGLLFRSGLGKFSAPVAAACLFVFGFFCLYLVGLHLALAVVRYLAVTYFSWIQSQDHQKLAEIIHVIIFCVSLVMMAVIMPFRVSPSEVISVESYLSGSGAQKINRFWWPLLLGCVALLAVVGLYLFSKWLLQKKAEAVQVQPLQNPAPGRGQVNSLAKFIDLKTLVFGSFYALGSYSHAALLDLVPAFRLGASLPLALLHVNNCILLYLLSRPGVWACFWNKVKQRTGWEWQTVHEWGVRMCCGSFQRYVLILHLFFPVYSV
jgi:hypothetical protein